MKTVGLRAGLPASLLLVLLAAPPALAQAGADVPAASMAAAGDQRRPVEPQPSGPMTVVPVRNTFVVAPTVRFGRVNHQSATFAGGTAGLLVDSQLFLGAGGYWLANSRRGFEMGYVGGIVGWHLAGGGPIDVSLSTLVGGGWSTMTWVGVVPLGMDRHGSLMYPGPGDSGFRAWDVEDRFFVAEPEATVCIRITRIVRLNAGVSYRFISGAHGLDNDLRGVTGTVAITFAAR